MSLRSTVQITTSLSALLMVLAFTSIAQVNPVCSAETEQANKALARQFYEKVWFTYNPDFVDEVFAPEYVVHDTGDRKGVTEKAYVQKEVAAFIWANTDLSASSIDYQIADCDMVATRWQGSMIPKSLMFKILGGREQIPIINVMRFENGKVVEIWNHRHDIDTPIANMKVVKGLAIGLIPAFLLLIVTLLLWRKVRQLKGASA